MSTATEPTTRSSMTSNDDRVAHLVLRESWPVALCGYVVQDLLGRGAAGRDRCTACLRIQAGNRLGRPAWTE